MELPFSTHGARAGNQGCKGGGSRPRSIWRRSSIASSMPCATTLGNYHGVCQSVQADPIHQHHSESYEDLLVSFHHVSAASLAIPSPHGSHESCGEGGGDARALVEVFVADLVETVCGVRGCEDDTAVHVSALAVGGRAAEVKNHDSAWAWRSVSREAFGTEC